MNFAGRNLPPRQIIDEIQPNVDFQVYLVEVITSRPSCQSQHLFGFHVNVTCQATVKALHSCQVGNMSLNSQVKSYFTWLPNGTQLESRLLCALKSRCSRNNTHRYTSVATHQILHLLCITYAICNLESFSDRPGKTCR